jgi:Outer membrane protein beta-barrel domain
LKTARALSFSRLLLVLLLLSQAAWAAGPPALTNVNFKEHWRNKDNSNKYTLEFGAGIAEPVGSTKNYQNTAFSMRVGGGYQFNHRFGLVAQYDFNDFGIPRGVVDNLVFNSPSFFTPETGAQLGAVGRVHLWSFTLDPRIRYYQSEQVNAYVVGGAGFYRKLARFNVPGQCGACSGSSGAPAVNVFLGHSSNNAGGFSIGTGMEWRVSYLPHGRYFIEARYAHVENGGGPSGYAPVNFKTDYFPVLLGLRW